MEDQDPISVEPIVEYPRSDTTQTELELITASQFSPSTESLTLTGANNTSGQATSAVSATLQTELPLPLMSQPTASQLALWQPDAVIANLYKIKTLIGQGGMGTVHQVYHQQWQMDIAVKTPSEKTLYIAGGRERFQEREAREWVKLGLHPNITSCFYVRILDDDIPRIFIEYVDGGSLADWLKQNKISRLETVLDTAIQICWGLAHAHQHGLVHRDVKPANILMTANGIPKVTDFGLVKPIEEQQNEVIKEESKAETGSTLLAGTPGYAAPEQWQADGTITPALDVYAIGVMLYQMVAPLASLPDHDNAYPRTWGKLFAEALTHDKPANCPLPDEIWVELASVLKCCLAHHPQERYFDAAQLAETLQALYYTSTGQKYPRTRPNEKQVLADSLNNQAVSLLDLGDQTEAMLLWAQALEAQIDHPEATYNYGLYLWRANQITGTALIHKLREVVVAHPGQWLPAYLLALVYLEQGDRKAATKLLQILKTTVNSQAEIAATLKIAQASTRYTAPIMLCRGISGQAIANYEQFLIQARQAMAQEEFVTAADYIRQARSQPGLRRGTEALKLWHELYGRLTHIAYIEGWSTVPFKGHTNAVLSVCFSVDGCYALSGSADQTLKLWEVSTGHCLRTFTGHTAEVTCVTLSEDKCYALSGSMDKTLKLWQVETGDCLRTFEGHANTIYSVSLSPDGRYALSGSSGKIEQQENGIIKLWQAETGYCLYTIEWPIARVLSLCFNPDGRSFLAGTIEQDNNKIAGLVRLVEVNTGRCLRTFRGHTHTVNSVYFSSNGRYALSGGSEQNNNREGGIIKLWEIETGRCLRTFQGHGSGVTSVCFSMDGRYILSGSRDQKVKWWDVLSGECLATSQKHTSTVTSVCFSNDGRYALSGDKKGLLRLWSLDWELGQPQLNNWEKAIQPYLELFLSRHTPYSETPLPAESSTAQVEQTPQKRGKPSWADADFQQLWRTLGWAGYGWLSPQKVHLSLTKLATDWNDPPLYHNGLDYHPYRSIMGRLIISLYFCISIFFFIFSCSNFIKFDYLWMVFLPLIGIGACYVIIKFFQEIIYHFSVDIRPDPLLSLADKKNHPYVSEAKNIAFRQERLERALREIDPTWQPKLVPEFQFLLSHSNIVGGGDGGESFDTNLDGDFDSDSDGGFDGSSESGFDGYSFDSGFEGGVFDGGGDGGDGDG